MNLAALTLRGLSTPLAVLIAIAILLLIGTRPLESQRSAAMLYDAACAACHGADGRGRSPDELGFELPMPDFTDCSFATREPNADWHAVAHDGGPARAFNPLMPAFGEALTADEIIRILDYMRSFCADGRWPRGELNLPRPLVTEKAFPEDEAVVTLSVPEGGGRFSTQWVFEKRIGPRSQFEVALPLSSIDTPSGKRKADVGDIAVAIKHNFYHDLAAGSILSAGLEVVLPTGDEDDGFGKGTTVFEPFLAYGQILPGDAFVQVQALGEFPADSDFNDEVALRAALGRTWSTGPNGFGRAWTPMLEVLSFRELESGSDTYVDLVPQLQVTLPTRQHIMLNAGVRFPLNHSEGRDTTFMVYFLWDWFDGGLLDGW